MSNLDIALRYAAAGFKIFPLHTVVNGICSCGSPICNSPDSTSQGKHPRIPNGSHGASSDPRVIEEWFRRWPDSNIGMTLQGYVVIDVDPRNGGNDTFDDLIAAHGALPHTWTQRTGSGGTHYMFKALPGVKYKGALGAGVDLKHGAGQYIGVEPNAHKSGQHYAWLDEEGPIYGGVCSVAPAWLGAVSDEEKKTHRPDSDGHFHSGGRNNALYERARRLRDMGLSQREIYGALVVMNEDRCDPPLPIAEVATICKSAAQNDPGWSAFADGDYSDFVDLFDFIRDIAPPQWVIDGLIQQGYVYSLTARTNHGKTAVATALALSIAAGQSFGSIEVQKGRILYLCGENPEDFKLRLSGAKGAMGLSEIDVQDRFKIFPITRPLSELSSRIISFCAHIGKIDLIVVDTSVAYFSYLDENDNVAARQHGQDLRGLVNALGGPAILALSHPVKNAAKDNLFPRGGSGFLNEIDCNLTLWKESDTAELWHNKMRGPSFEPLSIGLKKIEVTGLLDSRGRQIYTIHALPITDTEAAQVIRDDMDDEDRLLAAMHYLPRGSIADWAMRLGWLFSTGLPAKSKVQRLLSVLAADKLVINGRKGWELTSLGKKEVKASAF